ncbi:hypothetical protein DPMN_140207 [Dreissena polymorpha]|uniref:Uncharacterized protein n=1 Tax=Dreissena polymorpha TaxID=45954 RepID=A0A9D4JLJ1_DREPO|nr:hypothetical protein DPMN_140207 [Dreissena polymorpha]
MVEDMPNKLCLSTDRFQVSISTSKVNISLISGILYNCGTMYGIVLSAMMEQYFRFPESRHELKIIAYGFHE